MHVMKDNDMIVTVIWLYKISILILYRVRHKSINTPLSHERLVGGLQDGGRGTHVTHFVQLYPQPLYTASQVRTTCRSWDEGVLTDVCLTGLLTDLCLTRYLQIPAEDLLKLLRASVRMHDIMQKALRGLSEAVWNRGFKILLPAY